MKKLSFYEERIPAFTRDTLMTDIPFERVIYIIVARWYYYEVRQCQRQVPCRT